MNFVEQILMLDSWFQEAWPIFLFLASNSCQMSRDEKMSHSTQRASDPNKYYFETNTIPRSHSVDSLEWDNHGELLCKWHSINKITYWENEENERYKAGYFSPWQIM